MTRNVELLQQTMQHILDHPEQHDQGHWVSDCGTAACFAGWAGLLSGMSRSDIIIVLDESSRGMYGKGAEILGITLNEALTLFHQYNTRSMLELMVKDLVNGDGLCTAVHYRDEAES